jgi:4'-phosphopantetheinyl transferase EntD
LEIGAALGTLKPPHVSAALADINTPVERLPEEARAVERAVASRRWDFHAGRHAAREALARLGIPAAPIPIGSRGAPMFPAGCVGSITHARVPDPVAVAIAAFERDAVSLGIDLEARGGTRGLEPRLLVTERELAARPVNIDVEQFLDLAFSIKEAAYKALHAVVDRILEFAEVELELRGHDQFTCRVLTVDRGRSAPLTVSGRWTMGERWTLALAALPKTP